MQELMAEKHRAHKFVPLMFSLHQHRGLLILAAETSRRLSPHKTGWRIRATTQTEDKRFALSCGAT